jgi:catechol 2,3-dioxygenase-like lactoylglutathione lyase family enzyme
MFNRQDPPTSTVSPRAKRAIRISFSFYAVFALLFAANLAAQSPARPRILGIAHVEIHVSDPAVAKKFYSVLVPVIGECAGCNSSEQNIWLQLASGQSVLLWNPSSMPRPTVPESSLLKSISFEIDDIRKMIGLLRANGVSFREMYPVDGDPSLIVADPEGHEIEFIQPEPSPVNPRRAGILKPKSVRLIHAGFVVKDRAAMDKFYKDIFGFRTYWSGGMKDGEIDWVDMQVPDGTDWIEYMLNVAPDASHKTLGVMNHIALGVPDIHAAQQQLIKNGWKGTEEPKIGRDGKWQLNLYDPDDTRIELMEFTPVEKPCCSEYTGPHPKP